MKKEIAYNTRGHRADIGPIEIYRMVSNNYADQIGHFVFLDYIPPFMLSERRVNPAAAHPHRGIATLTYILHGEAEHFDSRGHRGTVRSGGVQWMKAGNGIIHNEAIAPDTITGGKLMHGFQFWMNLPAKIKTENPEYLALQADQLPLIQLSHNAGSIKVVVGEYEGQKSSIPTYSKQFLFHIRLKGKNQFTLPTEKDVEYALFLPQHDLTINSKDFHSGDLIGFKNEAGNIEILNSKEAEADIIFFGGEKYTEPFVAQGPFVMSTQQEIYQAISDYQNGKYGEITYN